MELCNIRSFYHVYLLVSVVRLDTLIEFKVQYIDDLEEIKPYNKMSTTYIEDYLYMEHYYDFKYIRQFFLEWITDIFICSN